MKLKLLFLITLLGVLHFKCKKKSDVNEGSLIKRTLQTSLYQRVTVDTFLYNDQKRLTGIKHFNTNTKYDFQIEYDAQARLSKVRYSYLGREDYSCSFIYNGSGQIIKKMAFPSPGFNFANDESYAYDGIGRLISDTTYYKQTDSILYYTTFRYDNNGNIVEDDFRNLIDPRNQGKTLHSYDNNPNPFYIQGSYYFYLAGSSYYLNKNNIVESKSWSSSSILTHIEYQVNGLPKKFTKIDPNGPTGAFRSTFEVEYW